MRNTSLVLSFFLILSACGGGGGDGKGGAPDGGAVDGGAAANLLEPPPAGKGLQIAMTSRLAPGEETERCMFFRVPAEGLNVVEQEIRFTPGSHHFLVYLTPYKEVPTRTLLGEEIDTSGVFDCGKNGPTGDWEVTNLVGASQTPDGSSIFPRLPEGVALKVPGNGILLVNTHYLNASDKPLDTTAAVNLLTIPDAEVKQEAGVLFFYNRFIRVPARREATARMRCPVLRDINILASSSHMHKRGLAHLAVAVDPMTGAADPLFETKSWADVGVARYTPPKTLRAGQLIDYRCVYRNDESRTVLQGFTTRDEMCVFAGLYFPRHPRTELCSATEDGVSGRYMGGLWVGEGTADGKETAECLKGADPVPTRRIFPEDRGESLSQCLYDSCPAISRQVSDAVRCWATQALTMCGADCTNARDPGCKSCLETRCGPALTALAAAACQ